MTIVVESPAPTRVMLRRHYFPHWRLRNFHWQAVPILPDRTEGLVTFAAPAGRSVFRLEQGTAPYEAAGRTTSLVAFILLTMMTLAVARTRGPTPARP
jgi:hypothetical protein